MEDLMEIYVVQPGDTLASVAERFGVSVEKIIRDNALQYPDILMPGDRLVIAYPSEVYRIQSGDTLDSIANANNITVSELLRNNPFLVDEANLVPCDELIIQYNRNEKISTHGYTNTFIDQDALTKVLPNLTYLTIFNHRTTAGGILVSDGDDREIIQLSREYGVIPLMLMTTLTVQGLNDINLTYEVLLREDIQDILFDNVLAMVKERGYGGVNISAQFITEANQELFFRYTSVLSERLRREGFISMITINPKIEMNDNRVTFERINYARIGEYVDKVLFLQYKWGFSYGPPSPVVNVYSMSVFLDHVLTQLSPEKICIGFPVLAYDWELPYNPGFSRASSLSINAVKDLIRNIGVPIEFDETSQTPFIYYKSEYDDSPHMTWFINANTVHALFTMSIDRGVYCFGVWNIMTYYPVLWLVINSTFEIVKLLPEL